VWQAKWAKARRALDLPGLHFHDLRHVANTLTAATGASTRELMHRMGHASPAAALRYQHATRDRDAAIAAALGRLVARPAATVTPLPAGAGEGRGGWPPAISLWPASLSWSAGGRESNPRSQLGKLTGGGW